MKVKSTPSNSSEQTRDAVTTANVKTALKKTSLTPAEENVIRLRQGVSVDLTAALPTAHGGNEALEDELMLLEFQLFKAMKAKAQAAKAQATPASSAKSKIVSALGKKRP